MAPLHRPGVEPGKNAVTALNSVSERGYPSGWLACDRAYSNQKPENYQLPAMSLGYRLIHDYREDQLGIKGNVEGFILVEGGLFCPSMPDQLVNATSDLQAKKISQEVYDVRIQERAKYRARPKEGPDSEGHQRFQCPAAGNSPTARCPLKEASISQPKPVAIRIASKPDVAANPPKACRQKSVMVAPELGAKFRQSLLYGSKEWHDRYATLRNSIEGMNGFLKDGAHGALADPLRRRIRGMAAQSVLVAFVVMAANIRKIDGFLKRKPVSGDRRRQRRRRTRGLQEFRPVSAQPLSPNRTSPD